MRLPYVNKKQLLIMINVKDAAAVSEPAVLMRYTIQTAVQMSFSTVKWQNMHRLSVMDRPHFHIALVQDISPNCDCHGENDAPILPDIGMFASFDPVALDQACADACLKATPMKNMEQQGDATTIISKIPIRISSGKQPLTRQKRSDLEQENMN